MWPLPHVGLMVEGFFLWQLEDLKGLCSKRLSQSCKAFEGVALEGMRHCFLIVCGRKCHGCISVPRGRLGAILVSGSHNRNEYGLFQNPFWIHCMAIVGHLSVKHCPQQQVSGTHTVLSS